MVLREASDAYLELLEQIRGSEGTRGIVVAEPEALAFPPIDERLVQAIWNEQLLHHDRLVTATGKPVQILDPGRWNGSAPGPDFRTAEVVIGGQRVRGDVEIHVDSGDWDRHHHSRDFEYNGVILHAFLRRTDTRNFDELHNGNRAERLELLPVLDPDLETIARSLGAGEYQFEPQANAGGCHEAVARLEPDLVRRFLLQASRERLEEKVARFTVQRAGESEDQVLYQAVMAAMGHRGSKTLYFLLAKRTPIEELKSYLRDLPLSDIPAALESVFLHVASLADVGGARTDSGNDLLDGLPAAEADAAGEADATGMPGAAGTVGPLHEPCRSPELDTDTLVYLNRLYAGWSRLSGYYGDRIIPPTRRWFDGVRPTNFPGRRLAGVARLLAGLDFRRGLLESFAARVEDARRRQPKTLRDFKREIAQLSQLFVVEGESYWTRRYTLTGKAAPRPMQLIGDDRALSVLYNALLPNVLLYARNRRLRDLEEFVWRLHEHFPALAENAVTRFMRARLFGERGTLDGIDFRYEKFSQGLLHLFHECCNDPVRSCESCVFRRKLP